ncbi:hypothetical protein ACTFIZ_005355 [Dictyostelium cf. discoideum]
MSENKHHHPSYFINSLLDIEFYSDCNADCIDQISKSIDLVKTYQILLKSIKLNEDGTIPYFDISDVFNYYEGLDDLVTNKNIQDLFNVNIMDLDMGPRGEAVPPIVNNPEKKEEEKNK